MQRTSDEVSEVSESTSVDVLPTPRGDCRGRIIVFVISGCPYCRRALSKLTELALPFSTINLDDVPTRFRQEMLEKTGGMTSVPQIFFNELHMGGFNQLELAIENGEIDDYITHVLNNTAPPSAPKLPNKEREFDMLDDDIDVQFSCERDSYGQLVQEIRKSNLIADRYYHLKLYKQCFVGKDMVDWLVQSKSISRAAAVNMGGKLIDKKFISHVCDGHDFKDEYLFYRLYDDYETNALNTGHSSDCTPQQASELGEVLRSAIVLVYSDYLSNDGRHVDYTAMSKSSLFEEYVRLSCELQRVDLSSLASDSQKTAFFINIYNALVIHANVVRGPPKNAWERQKFFSVSCYRIGGHIYTLQDIENGILRGNRKGVGAFRKPFSKGDPRMVTVVENPDPRVHFALVCGAKSCPPIKTYTMKNLDSELELAANSFLQDGGVIVNSKKNEVRLSRILAWYKTDFGSNNKEILEFVKAHMGPCTLQGRLSDLMFDNPKITYLAYDWSLNGS